MCLEYRLFRNSTGADAIPAGTRLTTVIQIKKYTGRRGTRGDEGDGGDQGDGWGTDEEQCMKVVVEGNH